MVPVLTAQGAGAVSTGWFHVQGDPPVFHTGWPR